MWLLDYIFFTRSYFKELFNFEFFIIIIIIIIIVKEKEDEKIVKYQDLARELRKIWNMEVKIIPIVIGVSGTMPTRLKDNLKEIGIPVKASQIQKSVLLGTARILRKVLEV